MNLQASYRQQLTNGIGLANQTAHLGKANSAKVGTAKLKELAELTRKAWRVFAVGTFFGLA